MNAPRLVPVLTIALLAAAPVVDAKAPPPQKNGATYTGVTSQGAKACHSGSSNTQPCQVLNKVGKNGKNVRVNVRFTSDCADGNVYQDSTVFDSLTIKKGKYSADATYNETLGDGSKVKNTVHVDGKFKHQGKKFSVAGHFQVGSDVTFTDASTTHCASGKVSFTAKAK
jgi:hypothetical protein